jgi:hypothetical protein
MQRLTFYSIVKDDIVNQTLFQGTIKATLGLILMFFGGPLLVIPGLLCIGWGLIPYRTLKKQQVTPNTIDITDAFLKISLNGKKPKFIPLNQIEKLEYLEDKGILFFFDNTTLFAPYFSKRTFTQIQSHLSQDDIE